MFKRIFHTMSLIVLVTGLLVAYAPPASAQEPSGERPELRVPWAGEAGFGFTEPDGTPRSFFIDLARMIAEEADFDIRLVEYPSGPAVSQSIREGETDFLAGAGGVFAPDDVLVAGPVAQTELRLYVRHDALPDLEFATFDGDRIGAVRRSPASRITPPDGASMVEYDDQITAFGKLLAEEVDGVLAFSPLAYRTLMKTQLDTLIRPTGAPIRTFSFFAVLRREHADLMPRIETAIATLEGNGALETLRNTWYMVPQPPIPDVLTVGVVHFPPYYIVEEDGAFSGFAVEVIRELADRAGLALRYEEISLESWAQGPRVGAFDLLPARSVTVAEDELFEFTAPIQSIDYVAFVRPEDAGNPLAPRDGRIGILATSPLYAEISAALGVDLVDIDSAEDGARDLGDGTIDALFYPRAAFDNHLRAEGASGRFVRLPRPEFRNDLAIATRPGLGDLDERLNIVIQGFMGSARYREIASQWFDLPPFWTPARIRLAEITATVIVGVAILCFLLLVLYGRRQALRHAKTTENVSKRLGAVLDTAQNAIFGFDHSGRITIANNGARAMIPELESDEPHRWPRPISFLDPDDLTPLEPARDPIARALAGSHLRARFKTS
jgi:ABC-type amino acid transport substrate-binding protein